MAGRESSAQFHRDPLQFLDQAFPTPGDAIWLPGRQLCLAEAEASRSVLTNADGLYEEHSDFFHTRRGIFGPRSVQVAIGRASRVLLRDYLRAQRSQLPGAVRQALAPTSVWPDAGNWLVYRYLAPALVTPDSPPTLRRTLDEIVERAVLAGARQRSSRIARAVFRFRVMRELSHTITQRRARGADHPVDILGIVVGASGPHVPAAELAEIFLSFLFAVAGSVGFALGWSLYLLGTHPHSAAEPAWVVREALRLWPVAWLMARRPTRAHTIAGIAVTPRDDVLVCPYAVHRNPQYWVDPASFRPERWADTPDQQAFIPFGAGPHTCVAAALSMQLIEEILGIIRDEYRLTLLSHATNPCVSAALAPPRFTLGLAPLRS